MNDVEICTKKNPWEDDITRNTTITDEICYKVCIAWECIRAYAELCPMNFEMK
jgi:hypothetical protein